MMLVILSLFPSLPLLCVYFSFSYTFKRSSMKYMIKLSSTLDRKNTIIWKVFPKQNNSYNKTRDLP